MLLPGLPSDREAYLGDWFGRAEKVDPSGHIVRIVAFGQLVVLGLLSESRRRGRCQDSQRHEQATHDSLHFRKRGWTIANWPQRLTRGSWSSQNRSCWPFGFYRSSCAIEAISTRNSGRTRSARTQYRAGGFSRTYSR